jgi:hypothetical protein
MFHSSHTSRVALSVAAIAVSSLLVATAQAAPVTIVNPGFELPGVEVGSGMDSTPDVAGWNQAGLDSVEDSGVEGDTGEGQGGSNWWAYLNSESDPFLQLTSHSMSVGDQFTASFYLLDSFQGTNAAVTLYKLEANNTRTTLTVGNYAPLPQNGQWGLFTLSYTATAADAGRPIGILFDNTTTAFGNESWIGVDSVSLDVVAIPEPAVLGAICCGSVLGLARRRR